MIAAVLMIALTVADVRSVTIESDFGGLGSSSQYRGRIVAAKNGFVRSNGDSVPVDEIRKLVTLMQPPYGKHVLASDAGLTDAALMATIPQAERCLNETGDLVNVRQTFEKQYLAPGSWQTWLDQWFDPKRFWSVSDFAPYVHLTVETTRGVFEIESDSKAPLMLPMEIRSGGIAAESFDARLPLVISQLLPDGATNREILDTDWIVEQRSLDICHSPSVRAAMDVKGRAEIAAIARQNGLDLISYETDDGLDFEAAFALHSNPRIHATALNTGDTAERNKARAVIAEAARRARLVLTIPWIVKALAQVPHGYVEAEYGMLTADARTYIMEIEETGNDNVTAYVRAHPQGAIPIRMYDRDPKKWSNWWLYPDGTALFDSYWAGLRGFPFKDGNYDRFPHRDDDHPSPLEFVDLLRRPDGTWEAARP